MISETLLIFKNHQNKCTPTQKDRIDSSASKFMSMVFNACNSTITNGPFTADWLQVWFGARSDPLSTAFLRNRFYCTFNFTHKAMASSKYFHGKRTPIIFVSTLKHNLYSALILPKLSRYAHLAN